MNEEEKKDELSKMFEVAEELNNEKTYEKEETYEKDKPKVYVKTNNNELDNKGAIHYRQIVVPFIVLIVIVIIMEIFNFVS